MRRPFRSLTLANVCSRWLHLVTGSMVAVVCMFIWPEPGGHGQGVLLRAALLSVPLLVLLGLVPVVRLAEGLQARLMLVPGRPSPRRDVCRAELTAAPSASVADLGRTVCWLVLRVQLGALTLSASGWLPVQTVRLASRGDGYALLAPLPLLGLVAFVVSAGAVIAAAARWLLAPSAAERIAALEERTERLMEHNRLARDLHDSIGHALTAVVVQAGAARAAGSAEFTGRALAAIEETGRRALEELEGVLEVLREDSPQPRERPALTDAARLLDAARGAGAEVTAEVSGPLDAVAGPVSREGYRILQEALTNVVRHAGPVPVTVRIAVHGDSVELDIRNQLGDAGPVSGSGRGLRGIRERARLLGGHAEAGPDAGRWRVHARLPVAVG
ncbi:sensor histidine kinase [Streptomyces sp. NPDC014733]|uniref:sensor histidine kinase n=1 Tax=Streptomyces sp. NPDC014733 TaxID=3364885 RepID=UPI0036F50E6A